jgi:thiol-disulfide isomerase/thioredoxin
MNFKQLVVGGYTAILVAFSSEVVAQKIDFQLNPAWEDVLEEARKEHKIIFVDGYTTWCAPCRKMEKEVFSRPEEAAFFNQNFLNVKYDMEKPEGLRLKSQYDVKVFPTYLFINSDGVMLHRIVGAHTGGNDFLDYSKMALSWNGYLAALEIRYQHGERSPKMMLDYLKTLRFAGYEDRVAALEKNYLSLVTKDHFLDSSYWQIIQFLLRDPFSREFQILLDNQREIGAAVGAEAVQAKIFSTLTEHLSGQSAAGSPAEFNEEAEERLIEFLHNADFHRHEELLCNALLYRYKRRQDWDAYASVVDAMLEFRFLKNNPAPLKELDFHANVIANSVKDKALFRRALRWAEHACAKGSTPEEQAAYLMTKSNLQALLGMGTEAYQTKMAAEAAAKGGG